MYREGKNFEELARLIANEDGKTFKIVIVPDAHVAGTIAALLTRSFGVSKKDITQLGYTASDEQNATLLRRRSSIVIIPESILQYRSCTFYPPLGTTQAAVINGLTDPIPVNHIACTDTPFIFEGVGRPSEAWYQEAGVLRVKGDAIGADDGRIVDPAEAVPALTAKDFESFGQWALVAFSVRCAQRIHPVLVKATGTVGVPQSCVEAASKAIRMAEAACSSGQAPDEADVKPVKEQLMAATQALISFSLDPSGPAGILSSGEMARIVSAFLPARILVDLVSKSDPKLAAASALAVETASGLASTVAIPTAEHKNAVSNSLRMDYAAVKDFAATQPPQDNVLVPLSIFPPLWASGLPEGWPCSGDSSEDPSI